MSNDGKSDYDLVSEAVSGLWMEIPKSSRESVSDITDVIAMPGDFYIQTNPQAMYWIGYVTAYAEANFETVTELLEELGISTGPPQEKKP